MTGSFNLERFDQSIRLDETRFITADRLKQIKRDAFEAGRTQGYEAAIEKHRMRQAEETSELAQKIQEITFTHFEARQAVFASLFPLVQKIVKAVLPALAFQSLPDLVATEVVSAAKDKMNGRFHITCASEHIEIVKEMIIRLPDLPNDIEIKSDVNFPPFDVRISSPDSECQINLDQVIDVIQSKISNFFNEVEQEVVNG